MCNPIQRFPFVVLFMAVSTETYKDRTQNKFRFTFQRALENIAIYEIFINCRMQEIT
jgi:hypothetical protein